MDLAAEFLAQSRRYLAYEYPTKIQRCLDVLPPDAIWRRDDDSSNSIGNLLLHLSGNIRQWIVSGIGGASDVRTRQQEFDQRDGWSGPDLTRRLRGTVEEADAVLAKVDLASLLEPKRIQSYDITVMRAIYAAVEHFSMHTGQIILLAKMWKGDLGFYDASQGEPRPTWSGGTPGH